MPAESLLPLGIQEPFDLAGALGLQLGVAVRTPDELQHLLFASLSGRIVPFDDGSFDRWRPQRRSAGRSADAVFAEQLAINELVPVSSSPIHGTSLTTLVAQGSAWTLSGADMLIHSPLHGLGLLVVSEIGLTVAAVARAGRETLVIAVKYRLRDRLGLLPDWMPPDDRC